MDKRDTISIISFSIGIVNLVNYLLIVKGRIPITGLSKNISLIFAFVFVVLSASFYIFTIKERAMEKGKKESLLDKLRTKYRDVKIRQEIDKTISEVKPIIKEKEEDEKEEIKIDPEKKEIVQPNITLEKAVEEFKIIEEKLEEAEEIYREKQSKNPASDETKLAYQNYEEIFYKREELLNKLDIKDREKLKKILED